MNTRLLLFANDAASANVSMAYAYLHKDSFDQIIAFPLGVADTIYKNFIKEYISYDTPLFLSSDTVVTGTSGLDSNYEMSMIKKAKENNVKYTITIVDNVQNFDMRFQLGNKTIESKFLADEIWVFEKGFKTYIPSIKEKIVYKKDIYIEFLKYFYTKNTPIAKDKLIQTFQNSYLVILTEYIYELYRLELGFTEYEMLVYILDAIDKLNLDIPIFLKLHPKEHQNKFNILLRKYSHLKVYKENWNIQELIYNSKVVFGINSSVFKECRLFKKPTYSIQINSSKLNQVKKLNLQSIIKKEDTLISILKKYFS